MQVSQSVSQAVPSLYHSCFLTTAGMSVMWQASTVCFQNLRNKYSLVEASLLHAVDPKVPLEIGIIVLKVTGHLACHLGTLE